MAANAHVFLFGAPRSGTTWLQNMLGSQPEIVTPQESNLFNFYIGPWQREWLRGLPPSQEEWHKHRYNGLSSILTVGQFDMLVRDVVDRVYDAVLSLKPSATIVLDKVPGYTLFGPVIQHCLPDARFIQLIRDGRDVASSMFRASRGFGRDWSPSSVDHAAWIWRSNVEAGRRMAGPAYLELRFEHLRSAEGAVSLQRAFAFCGVNLSLERCREVLDRFSLERTRGRPPSSISWGGEVVRRVGTSPEEPADFFGAGLPGGWRTQFGAYERWLFDREAGQLLVDLNYELDRSWARTPSLRRWGLHATWSLERWRRLVTQGAGKARREWRPPKREAPSIVTPVSASAAARSRGRQ